MEWEIGGHIIDFPVEGRPSILPCVVLNLLSLCLARKVTREEES
jgi:hypothetical protein